MLQNRLDHWVRDNILTDHLICCNQLPDYIPSSGYKLKENQDISSKWARIIVCKNTNVFYQITALMNMQNVAYDSKLMPRKTVLAYLLKRKHNESLTTGFINSIFRWFLYAGLVICSPFYLFKWGVVESFSHIKKLTLFLLK